MDREGFRNRLKQYKEARGWNPLLKYWEWKQKYDSASQPDNMPNQSLSDLSTPTSQQLEDRAHRWDNGYVNVNREPYDSPYDDARYYDYRKPRFELRKGDVHYGNPKLLNAMGKFGRILRGGSILGEVVQQLFPSEEAKLIEDLRARIDKQNKQLLGLEDVPMYDEGGEVIGPPTYEDWYEEATKPKLNTFDNVHLTVGMEEAATDLHNMAMLLPGYADRWNEYMKYRPKEDPSIDQFVNDLWLNENPNRVGYRNGKYYPHKSPEGGAATIGPGFKLGSGSHRITEAKASRGLTKNQLDKEAERIGRAHLNAIDSFINYGQDTNPADTVSPQIKLGLMDLRHQVGPMNKWHGLRDAVLAGDLDKIRKESTVTWNDNGEIKVDKRRKKIRDEKYFHYAEGGEVEDPIKDPVLPQSHDSYYTLWQAYWLNNRRKQLAENIKHTVPIQRQWIFKPDNLKKEDIRKSGFDAQRMQASIIADVGRWLKGYDPERIDINLEFYRLLNNSATAPEITLNGYDAKYSGVYVRPNSWNGTGHYIAYTLNADRSVKIHERTHASNATPQEAKIAKIIGGDNTKNTQYKIRPTEVYSRLMQYRHDKKLDPTQTITEQYLKENKKSLDEYELNMFSDDLLLKIFNDVAYIDTESSKSKLFLAEGGQVEPDTIDPVDMYNKTRYQVNGIPVNDQPLSGTDPVAEAMMWGIGGGAAAAALRKAFPTYGAMAGLIAFGDRGKDNMLVVPKDPSKANTPIVRNAINKEVKDYYATDVIPRDVAYPDNTSFITDENFMYDVLPGEHFNPGVAGYYDRLNNKIAINNQYAANKELLDDVMAHEVDHIYNRQYPLDKQQTKVLNSAYTVQDDNLSKAARGARKGSEKRATNKNIRYGLYTELEKQLGRTPTIKEVDEFIDSIPDLELLDRLSHANSYGAAYALSIEDRADLLKTPVNQYKKARATKLRKALKQIAMTESNQEQNYA